MNTLTRESIAQNRAIAQPPLTDALAELEEIECARFRADMARKRYERTGDASCLFAATNDERLAESLISKYAEIWLNRGAK